MEKFKYVVPSKKYEEQAIDYINEHRKYKSNINVEKDKMNLYLVKKVSLKVKFFQLIEKTLQYFFFGV